MAGATDGWLVVCGSGAAPVVSPLKMELSAHPQACNSWPCSAPCLLQTSVTSSTDHFQLNILNCAQSDSRDLLCVHPITTHHNYLLVMTGSVENVCGELRAFSV